jgi:curved DNA-binding protein CbpA
VDFYEILQVSHAADVEVIRAAYRVLARRHHPDVGGDPRRMAIVNEAWATLGDPLQRRRYDATWRKAQGAATVAPTPARNGVAVMDRRDRANSRQADPPPARPSAPVASASAPPHPPASSAAASRVIDFGRYAGWSVADLSRHDPDYLMWLERTPIGRPMRPEIQRLLELRRDAAAVAAGPLLPTAKRHGGWFR